MKLYRVWVGWTDGADVCVKAKSEKEARAIALELVEAGHASYELDPSMSVDFRVRGSEVVNSPDGADIEHSTQNHFAIEELRDDV